MLDVSIVLLFIAYAVFTGFRAKSKASENLDQYFLAGRSVSGWRAGLSMSATQFSADTPLLVTGLVATGGIFLVWQLWTYAIAFLLLGFLFASSWRRANVLTDAELSEVRYGGNAALWLRLIKAIYYGTVINCVILAFVLFASIQICEVFLLWHEWLPQGIYSALSSIANAVFPVISSVSLGLSDEVATTNAFISISVIAIFTLMYSTMGGLRSVIATDVVQFSIALLATLLYGYFVVQEVGGLSAIGAKLSELYSQGLVERMLSFSPVNETLGHAFLVIICVQWLFQMNSDGTGYLAQRAMACRSDYDARLATVVFAWMQIVVRNLIWIVIAVGLLIIFPMASEELVSISDAAKAQREASFVEGIKALLPAGVLGLMLTGMLAALASTLDTHLNWGSSYWSNDVYKRFVCEQLMKRQAKSEELVIVARISNILILLLAIYILGHLGSIQQGWKVSLLLGAGVGSVLILRWLWERINVYSELAAIVVSLVGSVILLSVFPENDQEWIRLSLMGLISTMAVIGITFVTPKTDQKILNRFYKQVLPPGFWGNTAKASKLDPKHAISELQQGLLMTGITSASIFLAILGLGKLLMPIPGESLMFAGVCLLMSFALAVVWFARLKKMNEMAKI